MLRGAKTSRLYHFHGNLDATVKRNKQEKHRPRKTKEKPRKAKEKPGQTYRNIRKVKHPIFLSFLNFKPL